MKLLQFGIYFASVAVAFASARSPQELVAAIQKADYDGDRATLEQLYHELSPTAGRGDQAPLVRYWRGFALWRRAINGFNESIDPRELESDLNLAMAEFHEASVAAPTFVEAKIGTISCLGFLIFMHRSEPQRMRELLEQIAPLTGELRTAAPDNPRLAWVLGGGYWFVGPDRGGGQDKAIETYENALPLAHKQWLERANPLEPHWGEPELLMSLAWSYLNRATPDLAKADRSARAALELVPNWHYVRDILLPQMAKARSH